MNFSNNIAPGRDSNTDDDDDSAVDDHDCVYMYFSSQGSWVQVWSDSGSALKPSPCPSNVYFIHNLIIDHAYDDDEVYLYGDDGNIF